MVRVPVLRSLTPRRALLRGAGFATRAQELPARDLVLKNLYRDKERKTFRLQDSFVEQYAAAESPFGFNGLGELVYLRTYSRWVETPDAPPRRERWHETVRRVVEGCFSLQWRHCENTVGIHFDASEGSDRMCEAEQMFDDIFHMRFLPPGRGLWAMGTALTEERGLFAALNNCGFVSTAKLGSNPRGVADPFCFLMDASMLGVGVGFDTKGSGSAFLREPRPLAPGEAPPVVVVEDSREGWVESVRILLECYLHPSPGAASEPLPTFDLSQVRPAGAPIRGFGGRSQGPGPLEELHVGIQTACNAAIARSPAVDDRLIVDIMNIIGRCVVAGNVRRTAEIAFGTLEDVETTAANHQAGGGKRPNPFLQLKDYEVNPDRAGFGWASNNSVFAKVGRADLGDDTLTASVALNGEPGFAWPENMARFGRMTMPGKHGAPGEVLRAADPFGVNAEGTVGEQAPADELGGNPCLEQTLESYELCCLVECFPNRHLPPPKGCSRDELAQSKEQFIKTLRSALLYAKSVSLAPTHWEPTNAVLLRNRRIGVSLSGIQQFISNAGGDANGVGLDVLRDWCEDGYAKLRSVDRALSARFCVRPSIKLTSVKPSGTVSLLAGATPGMHWPEARYYIRRVRMAADEALLPALQAANFHVEPAVGDERRTVVVSVPVAAAGDSADQKALRTLDEVTMWEQLLMASFMQRHWADNQVSCTVTFDPSTEGQHLGASLAHFQYMLKGVSFLPRPRQRPPSKNHSLVGADDDDDDDVVEQPYPQMPYERISRTKYHAMLSAMRPADFHGSLSMGDGAVEQPTAPDSFCDADGCAIPIGPASTGTLSK